MSQKPSQPLQSELKLTADPSIEEIRALKAQYLWGKLRGSCPKRFDAYKQKGDPDLTYAIARYLWNLQLAEAIAPSIGVLEVLLRNSIDQAMVLSTNDDWWFLKLEGFKEGKIVSIAREEMQNRGAETPSAIDRGEWLCTLSFRFWCLMLDTRHQAEVWTPFLEPRMKMGSNERLKSLGEVRALANKVREIRNRAFHHEPLWRQPSDFQRIHQDMRDFIRALNASSEKALSWVDRFPDVYEDGFERVRKRIISELIPTPE